MLILLKPRFRKTFQNGTSSDRCFSSGRRIRRNQPANIATLDLCRSRPKENADAISNQSSLRLLKSQGKKGFRRPQSISKHEIQRLIFSSTQQTQRIGFSQIVWSFFQFEAPVSHSKKRDRTRVLSFHPREECIEKPRWTMDQYAKGWAWWTGVGKLESEPFTYKL